MAVGTYLKAALSISIFLAAVGGAAASPPTQATNPYPADGALILGEPYPFPPAAPTHIFTTLVFDPGATAVKHVCYFSDDYAEVAGRVQDANLGPPPYPHTPGYETTYYAGMPLIGPYTDSLVRGTVYYWAVDETDALGNTFGGDIWSFAIQDVYASEPDPPNEATFVETDVLLSWVPGFGAAEYDIYMGTSWDDVNNGIYDFFIPPPNLVDTTTEPNIFVTGLAFNTKYYWRVDQVHGRLPPLALGTVYKGDVWCFTTAPEGLGTIRMDLWWNIGCRGLICLYNHVPYPDNPDETRFLTSFDSGTSLGNDYGAQIHGWLHPRKSGDYTFWLSTDDDGELFLSTGDREVNMELIASVSSWAPPYNWYYRPSQQSAAISLVGGQKYYIMARWTEYNGGDHCMVAWQGPDQPLAPVDGSAAAVIPGSRLSPFMQLYAHNPDPFDGQSGVSTTITHLQWDPGDYADQYDVYLSTSKALVDSRAAGAFQGRISTELFISIVLDTGALYYWAIDVVNALGPAPGIWYGPTWTFRTEGAAGGLLGLYYHWNGLLPNDPLGPDNPFRTFVMSRVDPEVNFNWGVGSPDPSVNSDNFACKWIGYVEAPVDANYTFYTTTDDGARLFIDGQKLPLVNPGAPANDSWRQQGMTEYGATIALTAGLHDIEMHHYESVGGAGAELRWSSIPVNPLDAAITKQIIPPMWLWPRLYAAAPRPPDKSIIDDRTPVLEWVPGFLATHHELYFSASYDDVNDRNPADKETLTDPCFPYPAGPPLELNTTYYWCVDEVKSSPPEMWDAQTVWSFTIGGCLSIDNMEDYNDRRDIRRVWRDGNADVIWGGSYPFLYLVQGGSSGSNLNVSTAVGSPFQSDTGPIPPTPLNYQAMVLRYDNDGTTYTGLPYDEGWRYDAPHYSEIEANTVGPNSLDVGQSWESEGVKSLSLSFQGHPISDGDHDTTGLPAYTVSGRGRDIGGRHDEFYFLSQYPLIGSGSIQAQVLSMDNTYPGAKAGVMIREKWTPYSKFAAVFMTPGNGVVFQYRYSEDGPTTSITKPGVSLPQYVRLERTISGAFRAKHSDNGLVWEDMNTPHLIYIAIIDDPNLYIGTAVTSHNAGEICTADFNNLLISPLPSNLIFGNIGTNDPEQLYVALEDTVGNVGVVEHDDPNAATLTTWQEWNIPLTDFTGVDMNSVKKVYIGLGDKAAPVQGGSGAIYVDDIRACPPRCVAALAKPLYDIAQPYDCVVDEKDLQVLASDYLMFDELIVTSAPSDVNLTAYYQFEGNYYDSSVHANHLIDPCSSYPGFDTGVVGSLALSLDGVDDYLVADSNVGIAGNKPRTIACWAKADHTNISNRSLIFGFTTANGGNGSHFNIGYSRYYIIQREPSFIAHIGGWQEQILPLDVGVWHHFAMTYDGSEITYYGDGIELDTDPYKSNVRNLTHADNIHVGKRATQATYFPGKVDEARIYSVQLSKEQIAYLATNGAPTLHIQIPSDADVYQGEAPGSQWINFRDYALIADKYLEQVLWPTP